MTKVGFMLCLDLSWQGGLNYYKNLFHAVYALPDRHLEIVVFTGKKGHHQLAAGLPEIELVLSSAFDRLSFLWWVRKICHKVFRRDPILQYLLIRNRISVLSHFNEAAIFKQVPVLSWIPDFQHLHLPEFFTTKEIMARNKLFDFLVNHSRLIVLSSYTAKEDFRKFSPENVHKVRVLQFCANPDLMGENHVSISDLKSKYQIQDNYFFLPNQFWAHKNHQVVIAALALAVKENKKIQIVCTGSTKDYRQPDYFKKIQSLVSNSDLDNNFRILGVVPYADLIALMKYSIAIINPSLFEGWSTTVEEAKLMGKTVLLSNIGVHQEQNPVGGCYFPPDDPVALAHHMGALWDKGSDDKFSEFDLYEMAEQRYIEFAVNYQRVILEVVAQVEDTNG